MKLSIDPASIALAVIRSQDQEPYEIPSLTVLGNVTEITLGSGKDTAELKVWYD